MLLSASFKQVHEAGDFGCVALVHEVPPPAAASPSESGGESEESEDDATGTAGTAGTAAGRHPQPPTSRAEASANVEPAAKHGMPRAAGGLGSLRYDSVQLRAAVEDGSLDALMAMGVPRLEASEAGGLGCGKRACGGMKWGSRQR